MMTNNTGATNANVAINQAGQAGQGGQGNENGGAAKAAGMDINGIHVTFVPSRAAIEDALYRDFVNMEAKSFDGLPVRFCIDNGYLQGFMAVEDIQSLTADLFNEYGESPDDETVGNLWYSASYLGTDDGLEGWGKSENEWLSPLIDDCVLGEQKPGRTMQEAQQFALAEILNNPEDAVAHRLINIRIVPRNGLTDDAPAGTPSGYELEDPNSVTFVAFRQDLPEPASESEAKSGLLKRLLEQRMFDYPRALATDRITVMLSLDDEGEVQATRFVTSRSFDGMREIVFQASRKRLADDGVRRTLSCKAHLVKLATGGWLSYLADTQESVTPRRRTYGGLGFFGGSWGDAHGDVEADYPKTDHPKTDEGDGTITVEQFRALFGKELASLGLGGEGITISGITSFPLDGPHVSFPGLADKCTLDEHRPEPVVAGSTFPQLEEQSDEDAKRKAAVTKAVQNLVEDALGICSTTGSDVPDKYEAFYDEVPAI